MQVFASTIARARPALLAAAAARVSTGAVRRSMLANSIGARRGVHIQNKVGSNMPFDYTRNKTSFTIKYFTLLSLAFALPFAATEFMIRKQA